MLRKNHKRKTPLLLTSIIVAVVLSGCSVITDEDHNHNHDYEMSVNINLNNYLFENRFDCKDDIFYWQETGLLVSKVLSRDKEGRKNTYLGVEAPFQVYGDQIFFKKRLDNETLYVRDINAQKDKAIARDVNTFLVYGKYLIYSTFPELGDPHSDEPYVRKERGLYVWDQITQESRILWENVERFCIREESLLVLPFSKSSPTTSALFEISLDDFSKTELFDIEVRGLPYHVMAQGNNLLVFYYDEQFELWNLTTGEMQSVSIPFAEQAPNNGLYARTKLICDDSDIFLSFEAESVHDPSGVESKSTGLWHIDPQTLKTNKFSEQTYERLYLFGGKLFGMRDNVVFQIDTSTGEEKAVR